MPNVLANVIPQLLAQGLLALRGASLMPRLVNSDYSSQFAAKGDTVNVPIPAAIAAQDVSPGPVPPSTSDIEPDTVPIVLDQWKEAPFYLTDKDFKSVMNGTIPMQASEAIKSLVSAVNLFLFGKYLKFYGAVGTAGTTPFGSGVELASAVQARKLLNQQLAPKTDRRAILDDEAEAAALMLAPFRDASQSGDSGPIIKGNIGEKMGFNWYSDQEVVSHERNALGAGAITANGVNALGSKVISIAKAGGANWDAVEGDIITVAGDTQQYVITADTTITQGTNTDVPIYPGLVVATSGAEAITDVAAHVASLAFNKFAIAFASRPLLDVVVPGGNVIRQAVDPVSGLALRLEVSREHKRTRFAYDLLYGGEVIRREFGVRIMG